MRRSSTDSAPLIVVGLGNPGEEYAGTRHNIGEDAVRFLVDGGVLGKAPKRIGARIATAAISGRQAVIGVPTTFMNRSGDAVGPLLSYYKATPDDLVVVHDDIDLPFARVRFHTGRGSGGNNGVASIIRSLGTTEFRRLRLGVGRPPGSMDPAQFVLRRFTKQEHPIADLLVREAADIVRAFAEGGDEGAKAEAAAASARLSGD